MISDKEFLKVSNLDIESLQNSKILHTNKSHNTRKWSEKEDNLLLNLIRSNLKPIKWNQISFNFNKTARQCYARYRKINPKYAKGKWSSDEENKLQKLVDTYGKKWSVVSKYLKTRSNKQIRDHYNNCMDKNLNRNNFTEEEINKIKALFMIHGPKWCLIAKSLQGRTSDAIKNKYYWSIKCTHTPEEIELLKSIFFFNN